ncbi:aminoacyl-tRNA hydrolase [Campylobacter geochelonis]|uniref:Peptidyl-tRNA hydrolase n=1 Tax=Campylobacter geochelonis TaxID=1780362 RepID=A0A128EAE3_9BACT|nr:aminoacyl-tRNA hydrolase [Campylobacter geochelonis]QKF70624.1 peptidyl-tRNA hydrolase [Campylobacter geochelonis]CZE45909.1 peptidyl-tRNA hydrolase [Campylobacter geochelonis]CZE46729.1 peptidyl-tRNA hydrolase [Campylobacter geochelonis]
MILVVGLGNPGAQYADTRHNIGFMLVDKMLEDDGFTDVSSSKFQGELYKKGSLLLLKPQTYMNVSGYSVKMVKDFYKPERVIVVHDDIDLNFGAVKFKIGGSSGGHNGIKSIDSLIGVEYERVRVGIGRGKGNVAGFVLSKFEDDEQKKLEAILSHTKKATQFLLKSDLETTRAKFSIKDIQNEVI